MPWKPWTPSWAQTTQPTAHNDVEDERPQQASQNEALQLVVEQELHTKPVGGFDIFLTKDQRELKEALGEMNGLNVNLAPGSISQDAPSKIRIGFATSSDDSDIIVYNISLSNYLLDKHHRKNSLKSPPENPDYIPSNMRESFTDFYRTSMLNDFEVSLRRERSAIMERVFRKGYKLRFRAHIDEGSYPNTSVDEDDLMNDEYKILRYVWKGKLPKLKRHLRKVRNHRYVNVQDPCGRTACHFAASWGDVRSLQQLLRVPDININLQDDEGKTPLFKAIENGSFGCVFLLIRHGADPSIASHYEGNPFEYLLLEEGDESIEMIELLYNEGGMRNQRKDDGTMSYLHILGLAKDDVPVAEVAKLLLDEGENINATEGSGKTPLMIALKYNQLQLAHLLISAGANLDHEDFHECTALDYSKHDQRCFKLMEKALSAGGAALQPFPQ